MTPKMYIHAPMVGTQKAEYWIYPTGIRQDGPIVGEDPFLALLKSRYDITMGRCIVNGFGTLSWTVEWAGFIKLLVAMEKTVTKFGGEMYILDADKKHTIKSYFRFNYSLKSRG